MARAFLGQSVRFGSTKIKIFGIGKPKVLPKIIKTVIIDKVKIIVSVSQKNNFPIIRIELKYLISTEPEIIP